LPTVLVKHALDRALNLEAIDWRAEVLTLRKKAKASEREARASKPSVRKAGTTRPTSSRNMWANTSTPVTASWRLIFTATSSCGFQRHEDSFGALALYVVQRGRERNRRDHGEQEVQFATDVNGNISSVAVRFDDKAKEIMLTRKVDPRLSDTNYLARFVGEYDLSGHVLKVSLAGGGLRLDIPGERQYQLVPNLDGGFTLKEQGAFSLKFATDEKNQTTAALLQRPEGVVTARRKN